MNRLPKHITLKHLNAFVAVAQEASFTHAAHRLFQTQSSVTGLIRQLESALGTQLFSRTSRRVALTQVGQEFLPRVTRLLADFDGAIEDVVRYGALERGRVGVAAAGAIRASVFICVMTTPDASSARWWRATWISG